LDPQIPLRFNNLICLIASYIQTPLLFTSISLFALFIIPLFLFILIAYHFLYFSQIAPAFQ